MYDTCAKASIPCNNCISSNGESFNPEQERLEMIKSHFTEQEWLDLMAIINEGNIDSYYDNKKFKKGTIEFAENVFNDNLSWSVQSVLREESKIEKIIMRTQMEIYDIEEQQLSLAKRLNGQLTQLIFLREFENILNSRKITKVD